MEKFMPNLTKELFDHLKELFGHLKNSLQSIVDINETLIDNVKQLDLKEQKFIILLQKHAIELTEALGAKPINSKILMHTTNTNLPEFKLFEEITKFMQQTSTLINQKAVALHKTLSNQSQNKPTINKLLTGIERLTISAHITQKDINKLLEANNVLKPINNSPFKQTLENLDKYLLTLIENCGQTKTKLLTNTSTKTATATPEALSHQYKKHIDSNKHAPNKHLSNIPTLQQRQSGRHGNGR
jgi:hypothetical protein